MHGPPDPEMRSPAIRQDDRAKSQPALSATEYADETIARQALKLSRLFLLRAETARTVAALAFGGLAR